MQARYLHNDAVVCQTLYEGVVHTVRHYIVIVIPHLVVYIHHGGFYPSHLVPQQVDGHHGQGVNAPTATCHVAGVGILETQILAEPQHFCFHPRLLHLNQDGLPISLAINDGGTKVYAVDGEIVGEFVVVLVVAHVYLYHLLFQKGRENGAGYTLVFHEVLEYDIINWVGYYHGLYNLIAKLGIFPDTAK